VRIGALRSALSKFQKEGRLVVVDAFQLSEIKTKGVLSALASLKTDKKTMIVDTASNENLRLSIRNSKDHQFMPPEGVNVYDLLRHDTLVLSKDAAKALELRCLARGGEK
jgi:large subunit ribosomal protein L4